MIKIVTINEIILMCIGLGFNVGDFISGIIKAFKVDRKVDSSKLRDGLFKKVGFLLCYLLAIGINIAQQYLKLPFEVNILPAMVIYVIVTEVVSIIENIAVINPDILADNLKSIIGYKGVEGNGDNKPQL